MNDSVLANQALQLENKVIETVGKTVEALIEMFTQECTNVKDKEVLGTFQKYISGGGKLRACPINSDRMDEFASAAQGIGLTYFVIPEKTNPSVKLVVYMEKEGAVMNEIIEKMTIEGRPLVEDMQVSLDKLIANLGNSGLDETGIIKDTNELAMFKVSANKNKLPFAIRMNEKGQFVALTASRDAEKLRAIDGYLGMSTRHYTEAKDIKNYINDAAAKDSAEREKEQTPTPRLKKRGREK